MSTTTLDALTRVVLEYGVECIRVGTGQAVGHEAQAKFDALQSALTEALADSARMDLIRAGQVYIEPNSDSREIYVFAGDRRGVYTANAEDLNHEIDVAIAARAAEGDANG